MGKEYADNPVFRSNAIAHRAKRNYWRSTHSSDMAKLILAGIVIVILASLGIALHKNSGDSDSSRINSQVNSIPADPWKDWEHKLLNENKGILQVGLKDNSEGAKDVYLLTSAVDINDETAAKAEISIVLPIVASRTWLSAPGKVRNVFMLSQNPLDPGKFIPIGYHSATGWHKLDPQSNIDEVVLP